MLLLWYIQHAYQDLAQARRAVDQAPNDLTVAAKASCWALKRSLRAAFEAAQASQGCPVYSRDLY
eukprot:scaffold409923_cov39-Prasinocladus_malaysianus.AAC.1